MDIMDARFSPFALQFFELCSKSICTAYKNVSNVAFNQKKTRDILSILSHATFDDKEAALFQVKYISMR